MNCPYCGGKYPAMLLETAHVCQGYTDTHGRHHRCSCSAYAITWKWWDLDTPPPTPPVPTGWVSLIQCDKCAERETAQRTRAALSRRARRRRGMNESERK